MEIITCSGAEHLGILSTVRHTSKYFKNGEMFVQLHDGVRGKHVCIIQSFDLPNTHFMELCLTVDAVKRAGASYITVIAPYFPYCRMDKKHDAGVPISAKVVCDMLASVNIDRLISFDLHNDAIQGFLSNTIQFDHILLRSFFRDRLRKIYGTLADWVFCAPDAGSVKRVKKFASICNSTDMCVCIKHRPRAGEIDDIKMIGDVRGRNVLIADDMCDTGGTLANVMDVLENAGASKVIAVITHGVFSYPSYSVMENREMYVSNSCVIRPQQYKDKYTREVAVISKPITMPDSIKVFELKPFLLTLLDRISRNEKIGDLIDNWYEE